MFDRHRTEQKKKLERISTLMAQGDENADSFESEAGDSVAGGVYLESDGFPEDEEEAFKRAFPSLVQTDPAISESDDDLVEMVEKTKIEEKSVLDEWPPLGEMKRSKPESAWGMSSLSTASKLFPIARLSSKDSPESPDNLQDIVIGHKDTAIKLSDEDGNVLDVRSHTYNPEKFKNAMNRFRCPYPGCG